MDSRPLPDLSRPPRARGDLTYAPIELGGEEVVLIRDPVRGGYCRYNPLQAAMLRGLDGRRPLEALVAELSQRFDVEIPLLMAERFVEHARREMLLDVTAYPLPSSGGVHAQIARAVRRAGYRVGQAPPAQKPQRAGHPENAQLQGGLERLEAGDFDGAVRHFQELPDDPQAAALLGIIERAYIKAVAPRNTDFPTIPLFDPDRLLGWLSAAIGPFLFSWAGALTLLVLVAWAAHAYLDLSLAEVPIGPLDVALAIAMSFAADLVHELSHGLACRYYGGPVHEIGVFLQYHLQPLPYCDTSSSYLFEKTSHKLIVHLAGTIGSLMVSSLLVALLAILPQSVALYPSLLLAFGINTGLVIAVNVTPFVKYDGYYALADWLQIPNLRERSFAYVSAVLEHRLLGTPLPAQAPTRAERRAFLLYGPTAACFTLVWMVFIYSNLIIRPLVARLQGSGLVLGLILVALLSRNAVARPLGQAVRFLRGHGRTLLRQRSAAAAAGLLAVVAASLAVPRRVRVDAPFVLAPRQRALIRAEAGGLLVQVLVREGEHVESGQVVARMADAALLKETAQARADLARARLGRQELESGARPEELAVLRSRTEQAEARAGWRLAEQRRTAQLAAAGEASLARLQERRQAALQARQEAEAAQQEVSLAEAGPRVELLLAARALEAAGAARVRELERRQQRMVLLSPCSGTVATPQPEERLGAWIAQGDPVIEVHGDDGYVAEVQLDAAAPLGVVQPGDGVELRLEGAPTRAIRTQLEHVATAEWQGSATAFTAGLLLAGGRQGAHGHARIYGPRRPLGYAWVYLPLCRLFGVDLWSLW